MKFSPVVFRLIVERNSSRVYGCCGLPNTSRTSPCSTIRPAYMTATRSHASATMPRLWVISSKRRVEVAAHVVEDLDDLRLDQDVEGRRRLVGHHERRAQHQRQRDHQPLPHAAGELVRVGRVARRRDAHQPQHLERPLADDLLAQPGLVLPDRLLEVLGDPHQGVEPGQRLLEDHARDRHRASRGPR